MFDQLGLDLADVLAPWIAILISLSAVFWFKDFAVNLMSGLKFKFNPAFNEGDHIILDNEDAIIMTLENLQQGTLADRLSEIELKLPTAVYGDAKE